MLPLPPTIMTQPSGSGMTGDLEDEEDRVLVAIVPPGWLAGTMGSSGIGQGWHGSPRGFRMRYSHWDRLQVVPVRCVLLSPAGRVGRETM